MAEREITQALIDAFVRLARGDFSVRLERNFKRDTEDTLAFFVNLIGEELARLLSEREKDHKRLEEGVTQLSESFLGLAAGDFAARASRSHQGDPLDVLAYLFNNTAEEVGRAFAELEQQRRVLETTLESMVDGVVLLDDHGIIRRTNGAMARLLAQSASALVGRSIVELVSDRDRPFMEQLASAASAGEFRDRGVLFRASTGAILPLTVNGSFERAADGSLRGVVLVARDDRELRAAQAQLQLTDRLTTMGTLAAGVAHEINNPLAFVIANLDYVSEEIEAAGARALAPDVREEVGRALISSLHGAERVRQIVGDLKTFSRGDQETLGAVDLRKIMESAANMLRNETRHHASIEKRYGETPAALGNEARLLQVFLNLLQNAAQAIPPGNADANQILLVTGTMPDGSPFAEVRDTGCGIPEEHRARLFDAFFTTKPVGVGTGLGLSISHKIVSALGGKLELSSELGKGSTFRVVLPAAGFEGRSSRPPLPRPSPPERRRRVLVVDDEAEVGRAVERVLGRNHEVVCATRGGAALELLRGSEFDLILCDLMMPDMTGMELFALLSNENPDVAQRIVFMTGGAFSTGAHQFLERVTNRCIEKPFSAQLLRELTDRGSSS